MYCEQGHRHVFVWEGGSEADHASAVLHLSDTEYEFVVTPFCFVCARRLVRPLAGWLTIYVSVQAGLYFLGDRIETHVLESGLRDDVAAMPEPTRELVI